MGKHQVMTNLGLNKLLVDHLVKSLINNQFMKNLIKTTFW